MYIIKREPVMDLGRDNFTFRRGFIVYDDGEFYVSERIRSNIGYDDNRIPFFCGYNACELLRRRNEFYNNANKVMDKIEEQIKILIADEAIE